ncbi:MAG TPA: GH92 family glycosyl hydrolase [Streptosporangiaceae bacterium]|nr:GH92 family glycosyl hydrolase [Streptosporangiaceae bacterium]
MRRRPTRHAAITLTMTVSVAGLLTVGWVAATSVSWTSARSVPAADDAAGASRTASPTAAGKSRPARPSGATGSGQSSDTAAAGASRLVIPPVAAAKSPAVCSTDPSGQVTNCPGPVPAAELPARATDDTPLASPVSDIATLVDARTWTTGGGNTYPGADVPFGMVQWSPDTMPHRADGGGYTFGDRLLGGYSLTHLSGTGCRAAGDIPILPMTGPLPAGDPSEVTTTFTNSGETAQAGFYAARSNMPRTITSKFTATPHAAIASFTFPRAANSDFLIKLRDSQEGDVGTHAVIVGPDEIAGSETSGGFCNELSSKVGPQQYTIYFDIKFSRPFKSAKIVSEKGQANPNSVFVSYNTNAKQVVLAKVGISYVKWRDARLNWQTEIPGWDLTSVKASAQASWNSLLGEIKVSGGSVAKTQEFYSLLYKDFLQPNITSDVSGAYMGSDQEVHTLAAGQQNQYGMFSGWDIYHSLSQLQAMLDPGAASDMAQSLVNQYSQNGILPQWGYLSLDNYAQVGDPADAIIADFYAFGARNFHTGTALRQMLHQANTTNKVRPATRVEAKFGYLPQDAGYGCCDLKDYVSALLEYDTADFALSQYALALGDSKNARLLRNRANNWTHVFNFANHLLTTKFKNGSFASGVVPGTTKRYLEGTAYQYLWDVPNNYKGLFAKLGGNGKVKPMLADYLSKPNGRGLHAYLANEFDLGEQFAPDYAAFPSETQSVVNNLRRNLYLPGPSGLTNNDDLGSESSQYVWEMLGFYPENPGSGTLVFASPGFPRAVISLPSGGVITINAPGASGSKFYVQSLGINGSPYSKLYVPFSVLAKGATLDWTLESKPTGWGSAKADVPPSYGIVKS